MALNIAASFPGQSTAPNANYPLGGAQNITAPGDNTGTPFVAALVNDWFGFFQGILASASIVASGASDTAVVSQYRDALDIIIAASITTNVPNATETVAGKAEIATQAETDAGLDDSRIITALKLANSGVLSITDSGSNANGEFIEYSNGLIIQWQSTAITILAGASQSTPFPVSFVTSTPLVIVMDDNRTDPQINVGYTARSATDFTASNSGSGSSKDYTWFAIEF